MKKLITLFTLLFYITVESQVPFSNVLNINAEISGIAIKDNYLYFGSYDTGTIKKINLTGSPNQTPTVVVTNSIGGLMDLQFNGNDLYISQFSSGTIKKVDVSVSNPVLVDIANGFNAPIAIQFYYNYLYVAEGYGFKISRIDLNIANPTKEIIITNVSHPWKIQVFGDELYIAEYSGNKISKFNLQDTNPTLVDVYNTTSPFSIGLKDNYLYFENNYSPPARLLKIDLTSSSSVPADVNLASWSSGHNISWIIHGNYLFKEFGYSYPFKINKYDLNSTLGLGEVLYEDKLFFYPNPAQNNITFNQEVKTVSVYTLDGKLLNTQLINNQIDLSGFNPGIYLVRGTTNDGVTFSEKLVKN